MTNDQRIMINLLMRILRISKTLNLQPCRYRYKKMHFANYQNYNINDFLVTSYYHIFDGVAKIYVKTRVEVSIF